VWADAVPNLLIGLREGLEDGLVVSILLAALKRTRPEGARAGSAPVWLGVLAAVLLAISFGAVLTFSRSALSNTAQEAFGGTLSLIAVCLVTAMVFWMRRTSGTAGLFWGFPLSFRGTALRPFSGRPEARAPRGGPRRPRRACPGRCRSCGR
jgi:hypothetical protein